MKRLGVDAGAGNVRLAMLDGNLNNTKIISAASEGKPVQKLVEIIKQIPDGEYSLGITGANRKPICNLLGFRDTPDHIAILKYCETIKLEPGSVIDIGRENSRLYSFKKENGYLLLDDFSINLSCGAGGGASLEKLSKRLGFKNLDEFVETAYRAESVANISARCAVFAESDVVHHFQRGSSVDGIAAGLCQVISKNFVNRICKDKKTIEPVYMIGGVSMNRVVVKSLEQELKKKIIILDDALDVKAIGAAFASDYIINKNDLIDKLMSYNFEIKSSLMPLVLEKSEIKSIPYKVIGEKDGNEIALSLNPKYYFPERIEAYLGLDVGSVSTKVALIDRKGEFILGVYGRTSGRPIDAVKDIIREAGKVDINGRKISDFVKILRAATTGSGRDVAGKIIGADVVKNEITAQTKGATYFLPNVDTVFEIGGQDSKYISIDNGVVIDNEMNKACAASTGSFLEEQAQSLGIKIEDEFANLALKSNMPLDLGDRCTVFITNSLLAYQDASLEDKCVGLAYSICYNYLNRVVGDKSIGDNISFQGAVAFNKAVVSGFETILRKRIYVPEYPHLTGPIGAAKIAMENGN